MPSIHTVQTCQIRSKQSQTNDLKAYGGKQANMYLPIILFQYAWGVRQLERFTLWTGAGGCSCGLGGRLRDLRRHWPFLHRMLTCNTNSRSRNLLINITINSCQQQDFKVCSNITILCDRSCDIKCVIYQDKNTQSRLILVNFQHWDNHEYLICDLKKLRNVQSITDVMISVDLSEEVTASFGPYMAEMHECIHVHENVLVHK